MIDAYILFAKIYIDSETKDQYIFRGISEEVTNKIFFSRDDAINYLNVNFQHIAKRSNIPYYQNHSNNTILHDLGNDEWIIKIVGDKKYKELKTERIGVYLFHTCINEDILDDIKAKLFNNGDFYSNILNLEKRI